MSFFEILIFLLKRKRYSIGIPFLAGVLGFVIAWLSPLYYKSEIKVILDTGSQTTSINSLIKNAVPSNLTGALGAMGMGGSAENEDLYLEIVDGRDVLLATIEKFKLDTIYKNAKYKETLLKYFGKELKFDYDELTGIISCAYEAKNKELARDLVRFVVEEANARYIKLRKERALQTLEQLNSFKQSIAASADSLSKVLIDFSRDNNLLHLESQIKLTVSALAGYEEQIKNLKISEISAGTNNSAAAEFRRRRQILEWEVKKLRDDIIEEYVPNRKSVYVNLDWATEKLLEQERLENELKRLFLTLEVIEGNIVMEEANAVKNLPIIQVVQDAYLPDYKSRPKRALWAVGASIFATIFVFLFLFFQGVYSGELPCEEKMRENMKKMIKTLFKL
ncbi:MAG: hypothetical protein LBU89_11220 [Fibromonadaceae bacterium]|jgi:capsule polysaccharide export protein KpsE/RkpR|nr:hypothetical protein [Fibromonadaceae bacterium]